MKNENNSYVKKYQPKFARWIKSVKWDSISEKLSDTHIDIIGRVMQAEEDKDLNWLVWDQCDYILERIRSIAKEIKINNN